MSNCICHYRIQRTTGGRFSRAQSYTLSTILMILLLLTDYKNPQVPSSSDAIYLVLTIQCNVIRALAAPRPLCYIHPLTLLSFLLFQTSTYRRLAVLPYDTQPLVLAATQGLNTYSYTGTGAPHSPRSSMSTSCVLPCLLRAASTILTQRSVVFILQ